MKKYSKEEIERRRQILKKMSYTPTREQVKDFLTLSKPLTEKERALRAMVDDDFGISEGAKARLGKARG